MKVVDTPIRDLVSIKRALISVSDKEGIVDFARALTEQGVELLSTGGTFRLLQEQTLEQVKQWVGNGSAMLVKRALADVHNTDENSVDESEFDKAHELFFKHYRLINGKYSSLYPHVEETLRTLKQQGYKLAVCTNKPKEFTDVLLKHFNLLELFDCIVGGDTLSVKKPDPAPILHCVEQCGVTIEQSLMVGDSLADINGAKNAEMDVVAVPYGYHRGANLEDHCTVINDFTSF